MNDAVRLYRKFDQWAEELSRMQTALTPSAVFFVSQTGFHFLFGEPPLLVAVYGAFLSGGLYYLFESVRRGGG